jgi:uncharacterized protein YbjT (DUF2867 family)
MGNQRTIFVTGASGRQGGAVAKHLLSNGFRVRVLTRNPSSASLQILKQLNVEIVEGDLDKPGTFSKHLNDAYGVFCALTYKNGTETETRQGIKLADVAKECGVSHFIYSSVIGADLHTGVPHWESKFRIESHIQAIGLPYTIIRPSSFYENFLIPQVRSRILKGKLPSPINKEKVQQFISTDDIGRIVTSIFINHEKYMNSEFAVAAEQMNMIEVAALFSECLHKKISYQKIPGLVVRLALGKNVYKMLQWVNNNDSTFVKDLPAFRNEFPGLISLKEWINIHFK